MASLDEENTNKSLDKKGPFTLINSIRLKFKSISSTEKKALIFLLIIFLVGLPWGIWQFFNQINNPFRAVVIDGNNNQSVTNNNKTDNNPSLPLIEGLKTKDTDKDGLSDYDELYVYETSPYLSDSDSDGVSDKDEITRDTNPNCPSGQQCSRLADNNSSNINGGVPSLSNNNSADDNVTADQLRQIMENAGAPADQLTKISDDDLLKSYREIITNNKSDFDLNALANLPSQSNPTKDSGTGNYNTNSQQIDFNNLDYDTLFNLSPDGIRQLLIQGGVPEDSLKQIDDETLRKIYQDSLQQNLNELQQNTSR